MPEVKPKIRDRRTFVLDPMRRVERAAHRELAELLASIGYPGVGAPQLLVFANVPRWDGIRMKDLADRMQLTQGAVTQLVAALERRGLVERVRDLDDGRGVIVRPTLASNRGYEASRDRLAEMEQRWRTLVGPRRWATFRAVLEELADAVER
ncbi:MAG TPA: MarR family transcriptional regulator [Actinomycetota bacterium]|jgi:DNA-binding MarR family transcriptional regulator